MHRFPAAFLVSCVPLFSQILIDQRLGFQENFGQLPPEILYGRPGGPAFTADSVILSPARVRMRFENTSATSQLAPSSPLPGALSLYFGTDPARWVTAKPRYASLALTTVYAGIDAAFFDTAGTVLCRITLAPGADVSSIRIGVAGVSGLSVIPPGYLTMTISRFQSTGLGVISGAQYVVLDSTHFGFTAPARDPAQPFVIEFTLPTPQRQPSAGALAPSSSIYTAVPTPRALSDTSDAGACSTAANGDRVPCTDVCLFRNSPAGAPISLSCLQGAGDEGGFSVKAASQAGSTLSPPGEDIFLAGTTSAADFPTTANAVQRTFGGGAQGPVGVSSPQGDIFVAKFDSVTGKLVYSTLLGGPSAEALADLHASPSGDGAAYVTGYNPGVTATPGAYLPTGPAFVAKLDPQGARFLYLTYLPVIAFAVDIGSDGGYYFASNSPPGFPTTPGAYQPTATALRSAIAAKLNPTGSALAYATYVTDHNSFVAEGIAVDSTGAAWLKIEADINGGIRCCFVAKLDPAGAKALYTGPFIDQGPNVPSIAVFRDQLIAYSFTAPISEPRPAGFDCRGAYVSKLDPAGRIVFAKSTPWTGFPIGIGPDGRLGILSSSPNGSGVEIAAVDLTPNTRTGMMCVLNGASFHRPRALAPGEIVTIFGSGLGPQTGVVSQLDSSGRVPALVSGTRVLFNGAAAPVLYAQDNQVNAIVPYSAAPGSTLDVAVEYQGQRLPAISLPVTAVQPDIFTADSSGAGLAVAVNQDGTFNSDANPAVPGSIVSIFLTGLGATSPPSVEGEIAVSLDPKPVTPYLLTAANLPVEIVYIGPSPGSSTSVTQINFRPPVLTGISGLLHLPLVIALDDWVLRDPVWVSVRQ